MLDYKTLRVWRRAHALAMELDLVSRPFIRARRTELRSQLTRAASSVPSNIVEGCAAGTQRELARYLDIAIKSANETEYHLLVARDLGLLTYDEWHGLTGEMIEIRRMTIGYRKKVLATLDQLKSNS